MKLAQQLEDEEGRSATVYLDSEGYPTIGIGRRIDKGGLSNEEMDYLLANDIRNKTREVVAALPWFSTLNEARRNVVVMMAFQLGTEGLLKFKLALAAMRDERWAVAAAEMLRSKWARQTPARAKRMAAQMELGE